ncbi:thiamine biosynthesis protein ThiS [Pilimelia terevasa]|uniref:Thiamine biosynthesis protein ThiS n=1 Tax=Pilimelia terevasa TaxID=53372 RepID=A0A8J3FDR8_9ACTN|nr:sulfur carrier protein ThiS [Pilimelia terevasa]GGK13935.1 thiamine biosynthesis protein ThiS [Pilimelia terevasa]
MQLTINGVPRDLPADATVADAVAAAAAPPRGVAVAVNGAVVPRGAWPATALAAGDRVEVLSAAQGG